MFASLTVPSIAPCTLGAFLANLNDEDSASAANLNVALEDRRGTSNAKIARAILTEAEVVIGVETIAAHRKGTCRCSRA